MGGSVEAIVSSYNPSISFFLEIQKCSMKTYVKSLGKLGLDG